jgi:hypothetical protein
MQTPNDIGLLIIDWAMGEKFDVMWLRGVSLVSKQWNELVNVAIEKRIQNLKKNRNAIVHNIVDLMLDFISEQNQYPIDRVEHIGVRNELEYLFTLGRGGAYHVHSFLGQLDEELDMYVMETRKPEKLKQSHHALLEQLFKRKNISIRLIVETQRGCGRALVHLGFPLGDVLGRSLLPLLSLRSMPKEDFVKVEDVLKCAQNSRTFLFRSMTEQGWGKVSEE